MKLKCPCFLTRLLHHGRRIRMVLIYRSHRYARFDLGPNNGIINHVKECQTEMSVRVHTLAFFISK